MVGPVRCQATPQHYAPYLGQCSWSFLRPPEIDFTLRAMSTFDVMEGERSQPRSHTICSPLSARHCLLATVCSPLCWACTPSSPPWRTVPMIARRLRSAIQQSICDSCLWPRLAFFSWADIVDSPPPFRVHVRLVSLHPPPSDMAAAAEAAAAEAAAAETAEERVVCVVVSLSEKQYDLAYTSSDLRFPAGSSSSSSSSSTPAGSAVTAADTAADGVTVNEEATLLLEAPHLLPRLRLEVRQRCSEAHAEGAHSFSVSEASYSSSVCLCRWEAPLPKPVLSDAVGLGAVRQVDLGGGWRAAVSYDVIEPPLSQDERAAAVLHVRRVAMLPDTRGANGAVAAALRLELRAGAWAAEVELAGGGCAEWSPDVTMPLARPDAQPLYATVHEVDDAGGDSRVVGRAKLTLTSLREGDEPRVLWAPLEPGGECALRVECALLTRRAASAKPRSNR